MCIPPCAIRPLLPTASVQGLGNGCRAQARLTRCTRSQNRRDEDEYSARYPHTDPTPTTPPHPSFIPHTRHSALHLLAQCIDAAL
jgi:hypothetical protein